MGAQVQCWIQVLPGQASARKPTEAKPPTSKVPHVIHYFEEDTYNKCTRSKVTGKTFSTFKMVETNTSHNVQSLDQIT